MTVGRNIGSREVSLVIRENLMQSREEHRHFKHHPAGPSAEGRIALGSPAVKRPNRVRAGERPVSHDNLHGDRGGACLSGGGSSWATRAADPPM
jgi:hypothetical protein